MIQKTIEEILAKINETEVEFLTHDELKLQPTSEQYLSKYNTPYDFIEWFLINYNRAFPTYTLDNKMQCVGGKNRSAHDIFMLTKHYFPEISLVEVLTILAGFIQNHPHIESLQCPHISSRVWYHVNNRYNATTKLSSWDSERYGSITSEVKLATETNGINFHDLKKLYEHFIEEKKSVEELPEA